MILNNYELSTFFLFSFMLVFFFYVIQTILFLIFYYRPKLIDDYLNNKFNLYFENKIKTSNDVPFFLRDTIITILIVPIIIIVIILFFDYKLIKKILNKTIKQLLFQLCLSLTSLCLFYYIIFYSSNYLVIRF